MKFLISTLLIVVLSSFGLPASPSVKEVKESKAIELPAIISDSASVMDEGIAIVEFAKTLIGKPYVWGSTNPAKGFDCSGFVNYVANHFDITVPRTSRQFTNLGEEVSAEEARAGDIILFTGTNLKKRIVGHMGIVSDNSSDVLEFIHSSSGKGKGVGISELKGYYAKRLVKIIRIFPMGEDKVVR